MFVSHLSLVDFRSYSQVSVEFEPGVNALVGPNGQGKTNLVEALGYVATLGSHRVSGDSALVRAGTSRALIQTRIVRGERASTVELEIVPGKSNRVRLNRSSPTRARDVLGLLHVVVFAPEDLVLVKGDPDARRAFLDVLSVQLVPRFRGVLNEYDRVLRQRGALLKSAGMHRRGNAESSDLRTLDVWDAKLAHLGGAIVELRHRLVRDLTPLVEQAYEHVSSGQGPASLEYRCSLDAYLAEDVSIGASQEVPASLIEAQLLEVMSRLRGKELDRGVNLVGPHRDDVLLSIGGLPAKGYASHGESWSLALALRLASYDLLTQSEGLPGPDANEPSGWLPWGQDAEPVMVLDDVFAELDVSRREKLVERVATVKQVLITAAVAQDVPEELAGARFDVMAGEVTRVL